MRSATQATALALAAIALARPQLGERPAELVRTGKDLLVVLDLSRSMMVTGGLRISVITVSARAGPAPRARVSTVVARATAVSAGMTENVGTSARAAAEGGTLTMSPDTTV